MNTRICICFMLFLGVRDYCKNEFDHVNKHKYCCKACFDQSNHSNNVQNQDLLPEIGINISDSTDLVSCIWDKQCKGLKGFKTHHWSCKTIKSFDKKMVNDLKDGLSSSEKILLICFNESSLKMMKNAFYFILKALFILKIFKFLAWHFVHVEEMA